VRVVSEPSFLQIHDASGDGSFAVATVPKIPTKAQMATVLTGFQRAGVTVVIGCTYVQTGMALIDALERLDFSPLAVVTTETLSTSEYNAKVNTGWWQGEYNLEATPWHHSSPVRGVLSGMTSAEFSERYKAHSGGKSVTYQGAAQFGAACALVSAIEAAGTVDTQAVASKLRSQTLKEFYGDIGFDANGQNTQGSLLLQYGRDQNEPGIVAPAAVVTEPVVFPAPTWSQRRCHRSTCSAKHGQCSSTGTCLCDIGWTGDDCTKNTDGTWRPTILSVEPQPALIEGGQTVTFRGKNFVQGDVLVVIGVKICGSATYHEEGGGGGYVSCIVPAGTGRALDVTISFKGGETIPTPLFSYNLPIVSSVQRLWSVAAPDTLFEVTGTSLPKPITGTDNLLRCRKNSGATGLTGPSGVARWIRPNTVECELPYGTPSGIGELYVNIYVVFSSISKGYNLAGTTQHITNTPCC
jgi:hypothetical protein